jgi:chromosomal replication initiation ATPase DnaA
VTATQLPLPFPHTPGYAAHEFLEAPSNAQALEWLSRTADWPGGRLALFGEAGCGKSHLLHRWAAEGRGGGEGGGGGGGGTVLPAEAVGGYAAPAGRLAIDDADRAEEAPLLHLLNAAAEAGRPVLLAARPPPARWATRLPDLASRLRAITAIGIAAAEDELLRALLARLLAERQIAVAAAVQDWLLTRLPRTPAALRQAAALLDRAALAAGGAVTRPLARSALADLLQGEEAGQTRELSENVDAAASCSPPGLL